MALRAGYYGVKKNLLSVINKLSGAKVIKTIGDGLKLTSAGKLSCDIDTETMEFKNGKLAAKATSGINLTPLISGPITASGEVTLLDDLNNYDMLEIVTQSTADGRSMVGHIMVSTLLNYYTYSAVTSDPNYNVQGYGGEYTRITAGQTTDKLNIMQLASVSIAEVNGINF